MRRPLGTLHVVAPASVGGLERVIHALAGGHLRRGHRIRVAAMLGIGEDHRPFLEPLVRAGVPVDTLPVSLRSVFAERRFVRDLCLRHSPDVVHTHGYRPDIVDAGVARRLGIPTCSTEHGMSRMGGRTALYEWLQLRALRRVDAVIAVSRPIAATLERTGIARQRIHLVPNAWAGGVEFRTREAARRALDVSEEDVVVGWVGRLIRAKGADLFLRALAEIRDLRWRAILIGAGPEHEALVALRGLLGLAERVHFHGAVPDAAPYFRAFDVFALTSRTEGTPIVLFEAMAAEVPVVATAVGGVPDVVGGDDAALVPPDDPSALARALRDAIQHGDAAMRRARAARERLLTRYALDPWLDAYEEIYRALADARAGGRATK